ncbi:hypothetical protein [Solirubrum puertoriconensis]|uniref:Uncharacterized protein n=1 Tax=Solirubrum puertoriconensis TaxID=1751427 RepID=A0A9X0L3N5_SOLP1|nr:hypothetical protein [Solirubrum puertoriconensis]KUG06652.1 hypothetical protein ASU33_04735 [Solirubrum puertoriconensis]
MWNPIHAQQPAESSEPFRKANAVLLYTNAAPDSVLYAMAENLRRRGFETAELDARHLVTLPGIETGSQGWPLVIRAERMTGGVVLTGTYRMDGLVGRPEFAAEFLGFEWSPAKSSFRQVEKTARSVGRSTIKYSRHK